MAAVTTVVGRGERFGRAALRLAAAGIVALLVLGAAMGAAGAAQPSRDDYFDTMRACDELGGKWGPAKDKDGDPISGVYRCTFDNGTIIECDLLQIPAQCKEIDHTLSATSGIGVPLPDEAAGGDAAASGREGPLTVTTATAGGEAILAADEDDERP